MRPGRAVVLLAPIALALHSFTASAQSAAPALSAKTSDSSIPDIAYKKFVLKNGLTLLVHEDHKAPIVAVNVWYHVGSKNEKPGKTGFAHLFEHLMFNGSENYDDDYFKAVEPIGATDLNGTTNEDRTNYFENVPVSALDRVLWLESDRMGHLVGAIDQAKLDEQRGVVQNEKRQGENQPYGKVWINISENTYPAGHPYSWDVIGSMDDLNAASLDDVKEWFRTYYGPANATLSIAGDIDTEDIRREVERYFGDIPSGPPVVVQDAWVAKMTGTHRQSMQDRVPQARLYKVWNVPGFGTADANYLSLATQILGGGKSSRLYKRLVYHDRIATNASAFLRAREIGGQFVVIATAQPGGDLDAVEKAVDEELAKFLAEGPTPDELARARTGMRADFIRGMERIGGFGGTSDILAQGQVYLGDPEAYKTSMARILNASPAAVQSAARHWLSDGAYALSVHPFPDYATTPSDVDRKKLPDVGTPPEAPLPAAERATLSNGLKIVLAHRTAVPVVSLALVLDAGYAADAVAGPGMASMTMSMLDEGTAQRSALQIGDELAALGAELGTGSGLDASTVQLSTLKDKLDPSLDLFADVILHPVFPAADLARVKKATLARIKQEKVQPVGMALRVLPALLYDKGHAYAQPLTGSGTEASVNAMTREDLAHFHDTWFKPNHATLVVVGDITMAELTPRLERVFKSWKPGDVPTKNIATVKGPAKTTIYILDRPGADQSMIFGGALIPPRSDAQELAFDTFNNAFGGAFVSRINMNLREGKHWSYGTQSFAYDARGQRPWIIYAPVQTDKTKESLSELVKELHDVTSVRPITADELTAAKGRQTLTLAGRWETGSAVSSALREIATYGLPADYYATFGHRVRALTASDISKAVSTYLDPSHEIWVIAGDRAKIEAGIRSLSLGDVQILDADGKPVTTAGRE
jgi:zinc protease